MRRCTILPHTARGFNHFISSCRKPSGTVFVVGCITREMNMTGVRVVGVIPPSPAIRARPLVVFEIDIPESRLEPVIRKDSVDYGVRVRTTESTVNLHINCAMLRPCVSVGLCCLASGCVVFVVIGSTQPVALIANTPDGHSWVFCPDVVGQGLHIRCTCHLIPSSLLTESRWKCC